MGSYTGGGGASQMDIDPDLWRWPGEYERPGKERSFEDLFKPQIGINQNELPQFGQQPPTPSPGQQPPPLPGQEQPQDQKQYFDAMRKNLDGLSEAFKQIENLSMPGGQHSGTPPPSPGGGVGKGTGGDPGRKFNPDDFNTTMPYKQFDMRDAMDLYNTGDTGMNLGQ
ncbi:hypothetical protein UFOVP592_31 [uncultured Caudovirales phage]|uniref:Uncharacterized protein n=1 Tax=uncultured Caudovirales phage TaxID=2100421 RepID=A0A6J5MWN9_9CAUD|nr:hypothetical protein UFOVP592_31 [uncultured Caudovirales phage]